MRISPTYRRDMALYGFFVLFIVLNIFLWAQMRFTKPTWGNVPPVMSERSASIMALGDNQMAYRMIGIMLQNLGNTGGDSTGLNKYNYTALKDWFFLEDKLDPVSDYMPNLAALYFGYSQNNAQLTPVIDYLRVVGQRPQKEKWRWLAHAIYLARFKQNDLQKALDMANTLANLPQDMPIWAKTMPSFVLKAQGDKRSAYAVMSSILASGAKTLKPDEILFLRKNICTQILTPQQAAQDKLCTNTP